MSIQVFNEINESHAATGYHGRTDLPTFHVFTVEDTYPSTRKVMPPYSFNFYQIVLLENSADAMLKINTEAVSDLSDHLAFSSPAHVLAWVRGEAQRGYIVYFKPEFLSHHPTPIADEFAFFRLNELNVLRVQATDKPALRQHCEQLLAMFTSEHPYRVQMLQALLMVLLFDCKRLHMLQQQQIKQQTPRNALAYRFQQFINQHFLTEKTVKAYADLLAVSPDHLNQTVKTVTGKTAYQLIVERVVLEAKKLLLYSDLNVGEIADYLGYGEPTHFSRFFRHYVGETPLAWQRQHL